MTDSLLQTKLYIPPLRPNIVPRPHLIEPLNQGLQTGHKLSLISAPAGFGKTTLVIDWVHETQKESSDTRFAWLSLDEGDNDLTRFLTYLVAALQTIDKQIGRSLAAALQSPEAVNIEAALSRLLNEITESPENIVLILDDYHAIESRPIDEALTFLLEHLPPQMHLVIASRIDPSLPLSRLRARGQMIAFRARDLRFTPDEAAIFLNKVMGLNLAAQEISALEMHTEGWIAGLQLAALSLQGFERDSDVADFVNRFTRSDRYIQDYLADEVLQRSPQGSTDFMLQTSILKRLCGPLCDAVLQKKNSQAVLQNLEALNLFILPLDNERRWYRYHHLFADLLAHRLRQTFPDQIPDLHRRASLWYENEGYIDEAVRHAQKAADRELLVEILEEHWQEIVHRGEVIRLWEWLDSLGPEYTKKSAPLSMAYCWIHVLRGVNDLIPRHIQDVKDALNAGSPTNNSEPPMRMAVLPSLVETMEATISLERKQYQEAKEHAQKAIALIPDTPNPTVRQLLQGAAAYRLAEAYRELGEYDRACAILLAGLEMLKASDNHFGAAATLLRIVAIYRTVDRTADAVKLCEDMLVYCSQHGWLQTLPGGIVHVILADLQADSGEYAQARKNLGLGSGAVAQIDSREIAGLLENVNVKLANAAPSPQPLVESLSPREIEVLQMIAKGLSNRQISEQLFLALDTVKGHNRRIYEKLGVNSRTQAVSKALSLKIISPQ